MKIYINGKFLSQKKSGVQRFSINILLALDNLINNKPNYDVILFTPRNVENLNLKSIKQVPIGFGNISINIWEQIFLPIYSFDAPLINLGGSAPLFMRLGIVTLHDAVIFRYASSYSLLYVLWYRLIYSFIRMRFKFYFTVSKFSAQELLIFFPNSKFEVIYNSAEHINFLNSDYCIIDKLLLRNKKYFIFVGNYNKTKNLNIIIDLFKKDFYNDYLVVIVGKENPIFRDFNIKIFNNIIRTDYINDSELKALYENAVALIFPSFYEGFGIPLLEAMYCKCPVIASSAASIPEVCGDAALYFNPYDVNDLDRVIKNFLNSEKIRDSLVANGMIQASKFSWHNSASKILTCIEDNIVDQ